MSWEGKGADPPLGISGMGDPHKEDESPKHWLRKPEGTDFVSSYNQWVLTPGNLNISKISSGRARGHHVHYPCLPLGSCPSGTHLAGTHPAGAIQSSTKTLRECKQHQQASISPGRGDDNHTQQSSYDPCPGLGADIWSGWTRAPS